MSLDRQYLNQHKTLKKVLLVYSSKPPIMQYLASAFSRKGITTEMVYSDANHWFDRYIIHPANKILHNLRIIPKDKSVFSNHHLSHKNYRSFNLAKTHKHFSPDMVLLIRGIAFRNDVLNEIRENTPLFGWWIEKEERIEEALREINLLDWYFFMNSSCVDTGMQKGFSNISLLHHSVDPDAFYPMPDVEKEFDICFVGGRSPKRQQAIEALLNVTDNIVIYGWKWAKNNFLNPGVKKCIKGEYIDGSELVKLYNKSRIVLNITNWGFWEGKKRSGMNMRVLEVPATGAFLLTDGSLDMDTVVTAGKHIAVYESIEDCVKQAKYYLDNAAEREAIAKEGCLHVRHNYTYDDVVNRIVDTYNSLPNHNKMNSNTDSAKAQ
jgi:glycosyltransferase involved in cell wall biosynthesis